MVNQLEISAGRLAPIKVRGKGKPVVFALMVGVIIGFVVAYYYTVIKSTTKVS